MAKGKAKPKAKTTPATVTREMLKASEETPADDISVPDMAAAGLHD